MLRLERRIGENLVIGPLPDGSMVYLTVVDVKGDKVRLGIAADRSIPVHRAEIHEANLARERAEGRS